MTDVKDSPPTADTTTGNTPTSGAIEAQSGESNIRTDFVGDRRGLAKETGIVRLVALIGFLLALFIFFIITFFLRPAFTTLSEQLFLIDVIGQPIASGLAAYASLRLGLVVQIGMAFAFLMLIVDTSQFIVRLVVVSLTLLDFIADVFVVVFIVIDVVYIVALSSLSSRDSEVNNDVTDVDQLRTHDAVLRQEANTIRLTGLFGFVAIVFLALFTLIAFAFSVSETQLLFFNLSQLPLAIYAEVLGTRSPIWTIILVGFGIIQLTLSSVSLALRVLALTQNGFILTSFATIFVILFVLADICFVFISVMYVLAATGYLYEKWWGSDNVKIDITAMSMSRASARDDEHEKLVVSAYAPVRRRKNEMTK